MVITNCAVAEHSGPAFDTKPVECYILHVAVADRKSPRLEGAARDRVSLHHAQSNVKLSHFHALKSGTLQSLTF